MNTCKDCIHYAYRPIRNGWVRRHLCTLRKDREILYNELACPGFKPKTDKTKQP